MPDSEVAAPEEPAIIGGSRMGRLYPAPGRTTATSPWRPNYFIPEPRGVMRPSSPEWRPQT
jgi:hypothetical protein